MQVKHAQCSRKHGTDAGKKSTVSSGVGGSKLVETWKILKEAVVRKRTDLMKMLEKCGNLLFTDTDSRPGLLSRNVT